MAVPAAPSERSWTAAASAWLMAAYAGLLPFHGVGTVRARELTRLEPCDAVLLLAAPVVLLSLYRARARLLAEPLFLGIVLLSSAGLLSEALGAPASRARLIEAALPSLAVGGVAAAGAAGKLHVVLRGLLWGGALALVTAAGGYALQLLGLLELPGTFVFRSSHPIFDRLPRMTGTFGSHAVWLGEYCILLLAAAQGAGQAACARRLRSAVLVAAALALLLSFSFAWLGGVVLCAGAALRRWSPAAGVRRTAWLGVAVLYFAASWWLLIGAPVHGAAAAARPCAEIDRLHHLARPAGPGLCSVVLSETPYLHRVTLYALAHETAIASFAAQPLLGHSLNSYRQLARERAQRLYGLGDSGYYTEPIGLIAGTLARTGALGAAGLLLLLMGIASSRPAGGRRCHEWAFYGVLALVLSATHTDLALRGPLWVLLGWLTAETRRAGDGGAGNGGAGNGGAGNGGAGNGGAGNGGAGNGAR